MATGCGGKVSTDSWGLARFDTNWYDIVHFTNKRSNTQKWIHCTIVPGILGTNEYPGLL